MDSNVNFHTYSKFGNNFTCISNCNFDFQMAEMKNCNKVLYFENRKRADLYLWAANSPEGPSIKFLVENGKIT